MTKTKSTRAFRTISEAAEELDLQAHVLRFWESKFSDIKPMKRRGGRRFYRPEDIEFLRGIKILLHREKHPIKDVQKLIRIRGAQSVIELGRSAEKAAKPKSIKETKLVPKRIKPVLDKPVVQMVKPKQEELPEEMENHERAGREQSRYDDDNIVRRPGVDTPRKNKVASSILPKFKSTRANSPQSAPKEPEQNTDLHISQDDKSNLEDAVDRLQKLKSRWQKFT